MISLGQTAYETYRRLLNSVPPPWENLPSDGAAGMLAILASPSLLSGPPC